MAVRSRRRLSLLALVAGTIAASSLTACGSGGEVVAGTRAPSIQELQEFVDQNFDEQPEADAAKQELLTERSRREQAQLASEEEELQDAEQPEAEEEEGEG